MKTKLTALLLVLIFIFSAVPVSAAAPRDDVAEPAASLLISSYLGWLTDEGNGTLRIVCDLSTKYSVETMGASQIEIQRYDNATNSWKYTGTVFGNAYNNLLRSNTFSMLQGVNFNGLTIGRTYRAVITFYAKNGSIEETRYYTTDSLTLS